MKKILLASIVIVMISLIIGCSSQEDIPNNNDGTQDTAQVINTEERQRIDLYILVMKKAFQEENGGAKFIAVKVDTLEGISDKGKEEVLKGLKSLSPNVYSFENVKNDKTKFTFFNGNNLNTTIDGTLLWVDVEKYNGRKATITGVSWFGALGAVFPKYEATFRYGIWNLNLIGMAIS